MKVGDDFPKILMRKIVDILIEADGPMSIDDIYRKLVNAGHPTTIEYMGRPLSLHMCVHNYVKSNSQLSNVILELNNKFLFLPQFVSTDLQECQDQLSLCSRASLTGNIGHIEKLINLLTTHTDIMSWANSNRTSNNPEDRYYSYLFLFNDSKPARFINEALKDSNFRVKCLAIMNIRKANNTGIGKIAALISDDNYSALISSLYFPHDKLLKAFSDMINSKDEEIIKRGVNGIMKDRRFKSIPVMIGVLNNIDPHKWLTIFDENYRSKFESHIERVSSAQGRLPDKVREQLLDMCKSNNLVVQKLAFKAMRNNWLKSDLNTLDGIITNNNPLATELKLEALYKKKSPKRLSTAKSYLKNKAHKSVRNATIKILGERGTAAELKFLMDIFKDQSEQDKYDIATLIEAIKKLQSRKIP